MVWVHTRRSLALLWLLGAMHFAGAARPAPAPGSWVRVPPLPTAKLQAAAACAAGLCAANELRETFSEIGHHHGVALLSLSHLAKAAFIFEELGPNEAFQQKGVSARSALRRLAGRDARRLLALAACICAGAECWTDARPGGHHGTVLLSLAELQELSEHALSSVPVFGWVLSSTAVKLTLTAAALACAAVELARDLVPGAHHGVAFLAASAVLKHANKLRAYHAKRRAPPRARPTTAREHA
ncbi:hypothetical protein M885DRAFT_512769 [Pelagophyceae sp. CCMP2097]|nr:hypothetical protein M885DRAFT_512769 [Pelagophyceae sp. CCMP2097]